MSNIHASLDLKKFPGAYVTNDGKNNVVVIPVPYSEIWVSDDLNQAKVSLNLWETNDNYKLACSKNHEKEEGYIPPSHTIEVAYSQKKREQLQADIAAKVVREKPEFSSYNYAEKGNPLYNEVRNRMRIRVGDATPYRSGNAQFTGTAPVTSFFPPVSAPAQPEPYNASGQYQNFPPAQPQAAAPAQAQPTAPIEGDDLPF